MIVNAYIKGGILYIGEEGTINNYCTSETAMNEIILKDFEVKQVNDSKSYIKNVIKLKEAGFTSDEIIELIGSK